MAIRTMILCIELNVINNIDFGELNSLNGTPTRRSNNGKNGYLIYCRVINNNQLLIINYIKLIMLTFVISKSSNFPDESK